MSDKDTLAQHRPPQLLLIMHKALSNMLQRLLSRHLPAITLSIHRLLAPLSISVSLEITIDEELLAVSCAVEIGDVLFVGRDVVDFVGEVESLAVLVAVVVVVVLVFLVVLAILVVVVVVLIVMVVLVLSRGSVGHVMLDGKGKREGNTRVLELWIP